MFDLNLTIDSKGNGSDKFGANNCDFWSGETSAANGEGEGESSSSNDASTASTFIFDISNHDQGLTSTESSLVTRDLFPLSRVTDSDRITRYNEAAAAPTPDHGYHQFRVPPVAVQQEMPQVQVQAVQAKKSRRGPRSRSSQYRGVTFYRRTGRWESHIWDCGKQVYLGGFDTALAAARAYDRAAIKFRGVEADINFNLSDYDDMKPVMNLPKEEFVQMLRRQSNGFSRGSSKHRGGMALQKCGRWETQTGEFLGQKYDREAIICNGKNTVTSSFDPPIYNGEIIPEQRNGGSKHDLDLNLGMSTSSPNKSGCLDSLKLPLGPQTSRTLMFMQLHAGGSASNMMSNRPLEGIPITSKHPILDSGVDRKFIPNNEERERNGSISQVEMANLAWRINEHDRTTLPTAAAASSGFSSPAPSGSASPVPSSSTYACYSWMKPYMPPS